MSRLAIAVLLLTCTADRPLGEPRPAAAPVDGCAEAAGIASLASDGGEDAPRCIPVGVTVCPSAEPCAICDLPDSLACVDPSIPAQTIYACVDHCADCP